MTKVERREVKRPDTASHPRTEHAVHLDAAAINRRHGVPSIARQFVARARVARAETPRLP